MDCESDAKPFRFGENKMKDRAHLHVVTDNEQETTLLENVANFFHNYGDMLGVAIVTVTMAVSVAFTLHG